MLHFSRQSFILIVFLSLFSFVPSIKASSNQDFLIKFNDEESHLTLENKDLKELDIYIEKVRNYHIISKTTVSFEKKEIKFIFQPRSSHFFSWWSKGKVDYTVALSSELFPYFKTFSAVVGIYQDQALTLSEWNAVIELLRANASIVEFRYEDLSPDRGLYNNLWEKKIHSRLSLATTLSNLNALKRKRSRQLFYVSGGTRYPEDAEVQEFKRLRKEEICNFLKIDSSLKEIHFTFNEKREEEVGDEKVIKNLKNHSLIEKATFCFWRSQLTLSETNTFVYFFQKAPSLESLELRLYFDEKFSCNELLSLFSEGLKEKSPSLKRLSLSLDTNISNTLNNKAFPREGLKVFLQTVKDDTSLRVLQLKGHFTPIDMDHIADLLKMNKDLAVLNISGSYIGDQALIPLLDALKINESLKQLDLSGNNLSNLCVENILDLLTFNKTLQGIYLGAEQYDFGHDNIREDYLENIRKNDHYNNKISLKNKQRIWDKLKDNHK